MAAPRAVGRGECKPASFPVAGRGIRSNDPKRRRDGRSLDRTRNPRRREPREARGDCRPAGEGVLDGDRDGDELHRELGQPGRAAGAGDQGVAGGGHPGGARARAAVRAADQGALRRRPRVARVPRGAGLPPAAGEPDRHRPRDPGCDRGRDRRDRALQPDHRDDGRCRLGHSWDGDRHPARRGGASPALRGLPPRVRGRRARLAVGTGGALLAGSLAAWVVLVESMRGMDAGPGTDLGSVGFFLGVWVTMTAAMMLPSAGPTALAYAYLSRRPRTGTPCFLAGYLVTWT